MNQMAGSIKGRQIFGGYDIDEQLGVGSMGSVYLAEHETIDQKIAVKVLHPDAAEEEETVKRFHREANVISMLSHPNIVRVLVFGETEDGLLLLALEYVEGEELNRHTGKEPMGELKAIKIIKQVCSAVAEAHDFGIIHRDLKPENVLLTEFRGEENFVKILDFGIAKLKSPQHRKESGLTRDGVVHGTPEFISPEQAKAEELDVRSDVYSIGSVLYEMVAGRLPFHDRQGMDQMRAKVMEEPPSPREFAEVDPELESIIMRAIARDREDRYSGALEMYDDLVLRQREILQQGNADPGEGYVPGAEVTGFHRADELAAGADASSTIPPGESQRFPGDEGKRISQEAAAVERRRNQESQAGEGDSGPNFWLVVLIVAASVIVGALGATLVMMML